MTRASFTAPGANRSTLFRDGKGKQNPRNFQTFRGLFYVSGQKSLYFSFLRDIYLKKRCLRADENLKSEYNLQRINNEK